MSPFDNLGGGWEWSRAVRRWVGLSWVGSKHQPITQSLYSQLYCLPPSKYGNCNPNVLTIEVDASFKRLLLPMLGSLIWSSCTDRNACVSAERVLSYCLCSATCPPLLSLRLMPLQHNKDKQPLHHVILHEHWQCAFQVRNLVADRSGHRMLWNILGIQTISSELFNAP